MLSVAIASCVVFLAVLISSYWWGYHSKFSLGSRLVEAKERVYEERGGSAQSDAEVLEFDYVFERNRRTAAQATTQPATQPATQLVAQSGVNPSSYDFMSQPEQNETSSQPSAAKPRTASGSSVVSLQAHRDSKQSAQKAAAVQSAATAELNSSSSEDSDDLKKIWGIGVVFENLLNSKGVFTFEQLANISDEIKEEIRASLGIYSNRIERDEWIPQATAFADSKNNAQRIA